MEIGPNKTASLTYVLTLAEDGSEIENVSEENPAPFNFGVNQLLPVFEKNLHGLKSGDSFEFILRAEDAYGPVDPYAIFDIPKDTFEVDGKVDEKMIQLGNKIPMTDDEGNKHLGKIIKIHNETLTMDYNHPLAGKDLLFKGKVLEVVDSNKN
jgi:FKBP-type peptidyl-prolyl cis-trans isomerase SlyD